MTEFVDGTIKSYGAAGAIISVLISVICFLVGVIGIMYRQANKVYKYRLAERDTLKDALNDSKNVLKDISETAKERNEIQEELSDLIAKQSIAFASLEQTVNHHYAMLKDSHERLYMVVNAISEAIRTLSGHVQDLRSAVNGLTVNLGNAMGVFLNDIRSLVNGVLDYAKRRIQK